MLSTEMDIKWLFSTGLTRLQVYNEILRNLQSNSKDELNFHLIKKLTDPSVQEEKTLIGYLLLPRETGGRNSAAMFDNLEERINEFMESNEGAKSSYELYNKDQSSTLILAIVSALMQREHSKVIDKLIFHKKLNEI